MGRVAKPRSKIPSYLKSYIVQQRPELYTAIDHAGWRFIQKLSRHFFKSRAHEKYVRGLEETGIHAERIPLISEMDAKLRRFGWRAVAVSGFIAPEAFMEFFALKILPIACDMRTLEHLAYTPAPDIVHEAAGHAPILADQEYADYLQGYGELARRAIFSAQDTLVYEAIRELSEVKENPHSSADEIARTERALEAAVGAVDFVSEATQVSRMGWWTFEYGLVGELSDPKIYGAGLLSSVGESYRCLDPQVKKVPFSVDVVRTGFDITKPQPQLFVARNFHVLNVALEELASTMAYRIGGVAALTKAQTAKTLTTTVLDSGLQITGVLENFRKSGDEITFLKYSGPCQLSYQDQELPQQGPKFHPDGFSSPLGLTSVDARQLKRGKIKFPSGIELEGQCIGQVKKRDKLLVLRFKNCTVRQGTKILFDPSWGTFDLACGQKVVSVFGGAADRLSYHRAIKKPRTPKLQPKTNLTPANRGLNKLFAAVRKIREKRKKTIADFSKLTQLFIEVRKTYPKDWLLSFEIYELALPEKSLRNLADQSLAHLKNLAQTEAEARELIERGLRVLSEVQIAPPVASRR